MKVFKRITSFFMACVIMVGTLNTLPYKFIDILATDDKSSFDENSLGTYIWHLEPSVEADDIIVSDIHWSTDDGYLYNPKNECAYIKANGKYGIILYNGTYLVNTEYNDYARFYSTTVDMEVSNGGGDNVLVTSGETNLSVYYDKPWGYGRLTYGYYFDDETGKTFCCDAPYVDSQFTEDYCVVIQRADVANRMVSNIEQSFGIANKDGIVVPCEYSDAVMHMNGSSRIIALKKENKWGYYNENGIQIIDFICDSFVGNGHNDIDWDGIVKKCAVRKHPKSKIGMYQAT